MEKVNGSGLKEILSGFYKTVTERHKNLMSTRVDFTENWFCEGQICIGIHVVSLGGKTHTEL